MARISLDLPTNFIFSTILPVRITDLNYGGHVGNDSILSLMHESRVQFLQHFGYRENDIAGKALIMGDVSVIYKNELFYGEQIRVHIAVADLARVSFDIYYKIEKELKGTIYEVARAKTGMVCYDYQAKKVVSLPEEIRIRWQ